MNEIIDSMLMPFGVAIAGAILGLLIAWRFLKLEESASLTPLVDLDDALSISSRFSRTSNNSGPDLSRFLPGGERTA